MTADTHPEPQEITRQQILEKHDKWLLRLMKKRQHNLNDLQQFWLFRALMFKHWEKFKDE